LKNIALLKQNLKNKLINLQLNTNTQILPLEEEKKILLSKKCLYFNTFNFFINHFYTKKFNHLYNLTDKFENRNSRLSNSFFENKYLPFEDNIDILVKKYYLDSTTRSIKKEFEQGYEYKPSDALFYVDKITQNISRFQSLKRNLSYLNRHFHLQNIYFKFFFLQKKRTLSKIKNKKKKIFFLPQMYQFEDNNSEIVADYFQKKLRKRYNGIALAKSVEKDLQKFEFLFAGLKMRIRGRFTKKQRATYRNFNFGKVSLNTYSFPLNYHAISLPIRYGAVSIKVWMSSVTKADDLHFLSQNYLNYNYAKKIN